MSKRRREAEPNHPADDGVGRVALLGLVLVVTLVVAALKLIA